MRHAALAALIFGLASACTESETPPRYHVADGAIVTPTGERLILRGANVSSRHKLPPYFDFHQLADYRAAAAWGFNSVRFLVSWAALEPTEGVYDDAYLEGVASRIATIREAGLYVIVDMHQDVFGVGFAGGGNGAPRWACDEANYAAFTPSTPWFLNYLNPNVQACFDHFYTDAALQARFAAAWTKLAARLVAYDNVIGFDILNEPHWGSYDLYLFEHDRLQPLYEKVIAAVRAVAPDWLAFVEPASSRNIGVPTGLTKLAARDIVYAPHSYDSDAESGLGFSTEKRAQLTANVAALRTEADKLGAALWIGEYGGIAAHANIGEYIDAQYDAIAAVGGSSAYWHYGKDNGYGILDDSGAEKPALMQVLVRPYPERVDGELVSYAYDESSTKLTITTRGASAMTVRWPSRLATPNAACAGCTVTTPANGTLQINGAIPAVLEIAPSL